MSDVAAVRAALDLMHLPSQVRHARQAALPEGVPLLLRIAAGEEDAAAQGAELTGRPPETVRSAAEFFIEQILLAPDSDSYRTLGAGHDASAADLRRNMALLLRWLHPDKDHKGDRSMFAGRVTLAWENLKTQDRRAAYDLTRGSRPSGKVKRRQRSSSKGARTPHRAASSGGLAGWLALLFRRSRP